MLALPATTSATPSLQGTLNRSRAEAARRSADQLESQAQNLRAQADRAESEAVSTNQPSQPKVLPPPPRSPAEEATYTAQLRPAKVEVSPKTQDFLLRMYTATSQKFADSGNALKSDKDAPAVLNTQGQATGRIVNIEA
ncbi:MAG: hypothetical protein H7Y28_07360 [Rhodoferax sp.]|nr:hypothetical protein [Rhodoferax sp.]